MNSPVTLAVPAGRAVAPRPSDQGQASSAAPFATALDEALGRGLAHASDRGIDRRSNPEERPVPGRAERGEHRATDRERRTGERADAADQRAADGDDRSQARADRAASRAATEVDATAPERTAGPTPDLPHEVAVPELPVDDEPRTDGSPPVAEPPRGGLPALWALLMGGASLPAPAVDTTGGADGNGATTPPPLLATTFVVPVSDAGAGAAAPAPPLPVTTDAADPAVPAAPAAYPVVAAGEVVASGSTAITDDPSGASALAPAPVAAVAVAPETSASRTPSSETPGSETPGPETPSSETPGSAAPGTAPPAAGGDGAEAGPGETARAPAESTSAPVDVAAETSVPAGQALSADAGGTGRDGGADGAPIGAASTVTPAVTPAAVAAGSTPGAVADVDMAIPGAPGPSVGAQVARQVAALRSVSDGNHSMTLVLTPDTLGEVRVQVTLTEGAIELAMRGAHEHGRVALLEALPELRRDLESAGLNPTRLEVARDTGSSLLDRQFPSQQDFGDRRGQHDQGENRSRPRGRPADTGGSESSMDPNRSASSGVDVLA